MAGTSCPSSVLFPRRTWVRTSRYGMSIMVLPQIGGILVSISEVMTRIDLSDRSGKPVVGTKERNRFEKRDVPSGGGGVALSSMRPPASSTRQRARRRVKRLDQHLLSPRMDS